MATVIYYAKDAHNDRFIFDGTYAYESTSSLNGLNGKGKFRKFFKRIGKGVKKIGKFGYRVVKKVIPIANVVATFIPVVGWAAKAGLTAAEMAINFSEKHKKRRSNQLRQKSNQSGSQHEATKLRNVIFNQMYAKKKQLGYKTDKNIHVSPELLHEKALKITNSYTIDALRYIESEMKNIQTAKKVKAFTKEQLALEKQNIFNDVLRLFII